MKVYWAAPLFTEHQRTVNSKAITRLEDVGFEVYDPAEASQRHWKGRSPAEAGPLARALVFQENAVQVSQSDVIVAWLGGDERYTDPGEKLRDKMANEFEEHNGPGQGWSGVYQAIRQYDKDRKYPPLDAGTCWELGYAFGWNSAINATSLHLMAAGAPTLGFGRTAILAYVDDTDEKQEVNLMIECGVEAVARGRDELVDSLIYWQNHGNFRDGSGLAPEGKAIA